MIYCDTSMPIYSPPPHYGDKLGMDSHSAPDAMVTATGTATGTGTSSGMGVIWLQDTNPACADLVRRVQAGDTVESRDFLRPLFKWLKGAKGTARTPYKHNDTEKAFAFLEWMASLREHGDSSLGVPPLPHLQPKYGYNTIVTMSQRNDCADTAARAYQCMLTRGDEIDVFTYTSLMDVTGRNVHFDDALSLYHTMRAGRNQPNVVTFITLIRVLAGWHAAKYKNSDDVARAKDLILQLLQEAESLARGGNKQQEQEDGEGEGESGDKVTLSSTYCSTTGATVFVTGSDGQLEVSVYNAALAGFVKFRDFKRFMKVLQSMHEGAVEASSVTLDIICKFYYLNFVVEGNQSKHNHKNASIITAGSPPTQFPDINSYGRYLVEYGSIPAHTAGLLADNLKAYLERKQLGQQGTTQPGKPSNCTNINTSLARSGIGVDEKPNYTGCLGKDAPTSMRDSVIAHDMDKLLHRLTPHDCSQLQESDFITLLHQCRKRKWSDQIATVLDGMRTVSTVGLAPDIPPQPALAPSLLAYEAALAGYFCVSAVQEAWDLVQESDVGGAQDDTYASNALHFFRLVMKGYQRCGDADKAYATFSLMQSMHVSPTFPLVKSLLRGCGCDPQLGVSLLETLLGSEVAEDTEGSLVLPSQDPVFLQSYAWTSVEGYGHPQLSQHLKGKMGDKEEEEEVGEKKVMGKAIDGGIIQRGNRELLGTLFESVAVLGRPEKVEAVIESLLQSTCAELRDLMQSSLGRGGEEVDVPFALTLLMAACSTNSIPQACSFIHCWQRLGFLPVSPCLYSLALEALAGSVGGTSQREVCEHMPSLPFRGFLRVGAVKKLHGNISIPAITGMVQSQSQEPSSLATCHELEQFFSSFAAFDDEATVMIKNKSVIKNCADSADSGVDNEKRDMIMDLYLQQCCRSLLLSSPTSYATSPITVSASSLSVFMTSLLLFLQHVYARMLLVRSRPQQLLFHAHLQSAFASATRVYNASDNTTTAFDLDSGTDVDTGQEVLFHLLSCASGGMQRLQVPSNFQAKLMSAMLKCAPEVALLPSLKIMLANWAGQGVGMEETVAVEENLPSLDFTKEVFKFMLSLKILNDKPSPTLLSCCGDRGGGDSSNGDGDGDDGAISILAAKKAVLKLKSVRQMMATILVRYMQHAAAVTSFEPAALDSPSLASPVKILQVLQHHKLLDSVQNLDIWERHLVGAALGSSSSMNIRPDVAGTGGVVVTAQDPLIVLVAYVKYSISNSAHKSDGGRKGDCRSVCTRLCRLLLEERDGQGEDEQHEEVEEKSERRKAVAAGLLCRFQVLDCEEFSALLRPSEKAFRGASVDTGADAGTISESESENGRGGDYRVSGYSDLDLELDSAVPLTLEETGGLPVLTLAGGAAEGEEGAEKVILVRDLASLHLAEQCFAALISGAERNAEMPSSNSAATNSALGQGNFKYVVALDCEWRPQDFPLSKKFRPKDTNTLSRKLKPNNKCSLLQLATSSHVFLFDLMELEPAWREQEQEQEQEERGTRVTSEREAREELWSRYSLLLSRVLSCPFLLLLGFGLRGDLDRLRESFPAVAHYSCSSCSSRPEDSSNSSGGNGGTGAQQVEMSSVLQQFRSGSGGGSGSINGSSNGRGGRGLGFLCKEVLGAVMDKRMQCSDWQRRPLHPRQVQYAALDAVVLVRIWLKLHATPSLSLE